MKTETKILLSIVIGTVLLLIGGVYFLTNSSNSSNSTDQQTPTYQFDYSKGQKIGSDSAKVRLVEFSDFQCPACGAAESFVRDVISEYSDDSFQFVYRHFPLNQHLHAKAAANAAEAAGEQGKFWEMHDKIFDTQNEWTNLSPDEARDFFVNLAKEIGVDENRVREAIEQSTYNQKIQADILEGNGSGVDSTPTFYVNGRKLRLLNFSQLKSEVQEALESQ